MWFLFWLLTVAFTVVCLYWSIRFVKWAWHRGEEKNEKRS